ncbi:MAG: hypothetical protein ACYTFY_13285 [Planctomycetota bacterium]
MKDIVLAALLLVLGAGGAYLYLGSAKQISPGKEKCVDECKDECQKVCKSIKLLKRTVHGVTLH